MKICKDCKLDKGPSCFTINRANNDGLSSLCRKCGSIRRSKASEVTKKKRRECSKRFRIADPARAKNSSLKKDYGITLEQYEEFLVKQENCCAICSTHNSSLPKALHVDHDHNTGVIRGLLCGKCNMAIGLLKDDVVLVAKVITYLTKQ